MKTLILSLLLTGCGTVIKVKGGTTHDASISGEATMTQEIVLKLDVSACKELVGQDKASCIKDVVAALGDLVELVKSMSCKDEECFDAI